VSRSVHLVGSIPLANAAEVFEKVADALGEHILRIPDGETGPRKEWINALDWVFAGNASFERSTDVYARAGTPGTATWYRYQLKSGVSPGDVHFNNLGYADDAIASYDEFKRLKAAGKVPGHCRFQVQLAPAHSVIRRFVVDSQQEALEPAYDDALIAEVKKMAEAIPHNELAIQWDIASGVFERIETGKPTRYGRDAHEMVATFGSNAVKLGDAVPKDVELIYHLCYGDAKHKHTIEPRNTRNLVDFANYVSKWIKRSIQLYHLPVPRDRADDAYFQALKDLELGAETQLSIGLIHMTDGVEGTRRRLATAKKYVKGDFLLATECGFGRRPAETIPALLRLHAEAAALD
jgi:methionine synthase II (cobalamin-independent)